MKRQAKKIELELNSAHEKTPVPIVSDAAVSTVGVADGRLLPLVVIDTSSRPDIDDVIKAHQHSGPGDAQSMWAKLLPSADHMVALVIRFTRPSRCTVVLEFDVSTNGGLVDLIVRNQGLYLQAGREGDRLRSTMDVERLLIEVPSKSFEDEWNEIYHRVVEQRFRAKGIKKKQARMMAEEFISYWRELGFFRRNYSACSVD